MMLSENDIELYQKALKDPKTIAQFTEEEIKLMEDYLNNAEKAIKGKLGLQIDK